MEMTRWGAVELKPCYSGSDSMGCWWLSRLLAVCDSCCDGYDVNEQKQQGLLEGLREQNFCS